MRICPKCGGIAEYDSYHHAHVCTRSDCDYWEPKKPTNYERLISKSPEEMAEWIESLESPKCPTEEMYETCSKPHRNGWHCNGCWLNWLKSEAEE